MTKNKTLRGAFADLTKETSGGPAGGHLVFEILKSALLRRGRPSGASLRARAGRRRLGRDRRRDRGSAGRRRAASSRCAISARFWSALDCGGGAGGGGGGGAAARSGARTGGGAFGGSIARGGRGIGRCSVRVIARQAIGSGRGSGGRPWLRREARQADRCGARRIGGGAGRRTSSAKEGRTGRGGGSGICGSA